MLNPAQRKAVETTEGPLRILAGVGTGKTHTLIARIGYLIEMLRVKPHRILTLTFGNKAARDLNSQLKQLKFPEIHAMTFHALASKLLRQYWKSDFTILDKGEQETLLAGMLYPHEKREIKTIMTDLDLIDFQKPKSTLTQERLEWIRSSYQNTLKGLKALDLTGLLTGLLDLWEEDEGILEKCQAHYDYIMVDEYQDVNAPQIAIMRKLAEKRGNLCVAGDPDQTLYSWRESDPKSLADFPLIYPNGGSVTLTENYRNPPNILRGAENLIGHNPDRIPKTLKALALKQGEITLWKSESESEQFETVSRLIGNTLGSHTILQGADTPGATRQENGLGFGDIAILVPSLAEGKRIGEELAKRGIPVQIACPENFWEQKEIVDFMVNLDELKFMNSYPEDLDFSEWVRARVDDFIRLGEWSKTQIIRLTKIISLASAYDDKPVQEALFEFLDEVRTGQEVDNLVDADKINVLTMHSAKGLEFPVVMIAGLEEGSLPNRKTEEDAERLAEERRLLYVGMTRATRDLHLFFCTQKFAAIQTPSRFLDEIGYTNMAFGKLPEAKVVSIHRKEIRKSQMKLF